MWLGFFPSSGLKGILLFVSASLANRFSLDKCGIASIFATFFPCGYALWPRCSDPVKDSPLDDELPETAPLLSLEDANRVAPEYVSDVESRSSIVITRWMRPFARQG